MQPATCKGNPPSAKKRLPSTRRQAARGSSASIPQRQVRQPDPDQSFWPCPRDVLPPAAAEHNGGYSHLKLPCGQADDITLWIFWRRSEDRVAAVDDHAVPGMEDERGVGE